MKQKIKNTPTTYKDYYKSLRENIGNKIDECNKILTEKYEVCERLHNEIKINAEVTDLGINLNDYTEFTDNKYINGKFYAMTEKLYLKANGDYNQIAVLINMYQLAKIQKEIAIIESKVTKYNKIMGLSLKEYNSIIKTFYYKVQELMVLDGIGYAFEGGLGWTCINRCKLKRVKPHIDFKATKENKKKLIEEGQRVINKEEKAWCEENGIEYNAVDYRVFQNKEYVYEVPIINCTLPNSGKIRFTMTSYRHVDIRGKTNEDLLEECNRDIHKILQLPVDFRTRLNLCLEIDKGLYLNYIRNEGQKTITTWKTNRQD